VTKVFLVRHASAGNRKKWTGDDRLRPLDEHGFREAEGLVELLQEGRPTRVLSSGYVRCRQTVEPLAEALGLEVEEYAELAEGALGRRPPPSGRAERRAARALHARRRLR
jgi:8-oxo-(d)GTP phosphatase